MTAFPKTLDLEITSKCNLCCRYCYLGKPGTDDMSSETAEEVARYVKQLAAHHGYTINVNLYGGEPFLNFWGVQYLCYLVANFPVQFTIFTNGATATSDQIAWCKAHGISPKRSTAGCREAAELTRPDGYTDQWLSEGELWGDKGDAHRLTVTPTTAPYLMRSVHWLRHNGYYGPIDIATDDYATWPPAALEEFGIQLGWAANQFAADFQRGKVLPIENFSNFGRAIFGQPDAMVLGCGAGWETIGITVDGHIAPCHRFFRTWWRLRQTITELLDGYQVDFGPSFTARLSDISSGREESDCRTCEARQCCQHGCLHVSYRTGGNFTHQPSHRCQFIRLYRQLAIKIHAAISPIDPRWWERTATQLE